MQAQRFSKVRLQRRHRHAPVFAGIDAVTRMATTHRSAFDWLNTALAATTVLSSVTFMGGYPGAEQTGTNEKVMQDGVTFTAFVRP